MDNLISLEEKDLLEILTTESFNHKVSAFIRLVRLYKEYTENEIIYLFLENFEYLDNENEESQSQVLNSTSREKQIKDYRNVKTKLKFETSNRLPDYG